MEYRKFLRTPMIGLAIATLLLAGGCNQAPSIAPNASTGENAANLPSRDSKAVEPLLPAVNGEMIRGTVDYDYDVGSSISHVANRAEDAVLGTVVSWEDGRAIQEGDDLSRSAVLGIQVEETFLPGSATKTVFVEVPRGGVLVDKEGKHLKLEAGAKYSERSISDLEKAAPIGTRVLALTIRAPSDDEAAPESGQKIVKGWTPPFKGAELMSPLPQGLLFEDSDGTYVSGVADQADVEFGDWTASKGSKTMTAASPFDGLISQLEDLRKS